MKLICLLLPCLMSCKTVDVTFGEKNEFDRLQTDTIIFHYTKHGKVTSVRKYQKEMKTTIIIAIIVLVIYFGLKRLGKWSAKMQGELDAIAKKKQDRLDKATPQDLKDFKAACANKGIHIK